MKKALGIPEIEEILNAGEERRPEPPENLLRLLQDEIPEELGTAASGHGSAGGRRPRYLVAAALFVAVVGAVVTYRVRDSLPEPVAASAVGDDARVDQEARQTFDEVRTGTTTQVETPVETPVETRAKNPSKTPEDGVGEQSRANRATGNDADEARAREILLQQRAGVSSDRSGAPSEGPEARADEMEAVLSDAADTEHPVAVKTEVPKVRSSTSRATEQAPERVRQMMLAPPSPTMPRRPSEMTRRALIPPGSPPPSTGGTAEPNDQPYGDMFFRGYGTNPFVDTEVDALSTFGLDVDTGSYTLARSYIERGDLPPADAIRVEEFVNYFDYDDRPPRRGDFAISAEGAPSPFTQGRGYHLLRFGLHGREIRSQDRKPVVLTFVIDVSGSMNRDNRLGLVQRSLHLLLDELAESGDRRSADRVGLVVYGSRGEVVLEPSTDHRSVRRAIDRLEPGGSTNAEEGLVLGYRMARRYFERGSTNRVILCSDGVANVGRTGPESILEQIEREAETGIELTTVGFGMGNYNDVLMEQLADKGDGRYAYVDTLAEARRLFVHDLTGTLETIASDAKLQVEFDPRVVALYRLVGYENRDVADKRFRDDTVDAGEIGAGHQVTALYEVKLREDARAGDRLATLRLRYRSERSGRVEEESVRLAVRDLEPSWRAASPSLRLAAAVAEFAEILKGSYWVKDGDLGDLESRARELTHDFSGDSDVAELAHLIGRAARLEVR